MFEVFPEVEVAYLTADRAFLRQAWFEYLLESAQLEFPIRIRDSNKLDNGCQSLKAEVVFSSLAKLAFQRFDSSLATAFVA